MARMHPERSRCASVARDDENADRFGIVAGDGSIDWQSVLAWKWHCQETFAGDQGGNRRGVRHRARTR